MKNSRIGANEIATRLRESIQTEAIGFQERLPSERELAERFNVSRGTVRSALNKLVEASMIEIRPNSGAFVVWSDLKAKEFPLRSTKPLDLIDARFAFEPHICRLAVLNANRDDFIDLEKLLEGMEGAVNDPVLFAEIDTQFHRKLVEPSNNPFLLWISDRMTEIRALGEWSRMRELTLEPEIIKHYNLQHRKIFEAIKGHKAELAANMMKEHLETARLSLTRAYEV